MIKINGQTAKKLLIQLEADKRKVLDNERSSRTYSFLNGEEPFVPEYDFAAVQEQLADIGEKEVKIRHARNQFNAATVLDGIGLTIDAAIVRQAQLKDEIMRLGNMRTIPQKTRNMPMGAKASEYTCRNFDLEPVEAAYQAAVAEQAALHEAIDRANVTEIFEVDIDL